MGWGGGEGGLNYTQMCVLKSEGQGSFFRLQVSVMSEINSLKMGAKFGTSPNMGENLQQGSSIMV